MHCLCLKIETQIITTNFQVGHRGLVGLFINNKFIWCQGSRVRTPSPTFILLNVSFEECIVSGWPREEDEEQEQEDHGRVKQEERGRRRRRSDQERLREMLSVRLRKTIKW